MTAHDPAGDLAQAARIERLSELYDQYDECWLRHWARGITTNPPPPEVVERALARLTVLAAARRETAPEIAALEAVRSAAERWRGWVTGMPIAGPERELWDALDAARRDAPAPGPDERDARLAELERENARLRAAFTDMAGREPDELDLGESALVDPEES